MKITTKSQAHIFKHPSKENTASRLKSIKQASNGTKC